MYGSGLHLPMAVRKSKIVRKARSARRRTLRRWRIFRSPRGTYLDLSPDYRRTLLLVGSARSGSTWLSDVLEESLRARMVFEPLRRDKVALARAGPWGRSAEPAERDDALDAVLRRILTGRVRSHWSDKFNRVRLPRRRLVKEIRATNLLPRIVARYPGMPVVYLLRHPIPAAWSAADLHWKPYLGEFLSQPKLVDGPLAPLRALVDEIAAGDDPFERHVLRWCMENYVPVHGLAPGSVHVVLYENVVEDPEGEIDRLRRYLQRFGDRWALGSRRPAALDLPSRANYRGTPVLGVEERLGAWRHEVPPAQIGRALAVVGAFGLDRIYGDDVRPLVGPEEVLEGTAGDACT